MYKYLTPQKERAIISFWKWFLKNETTVFHELVNTNSDKVIFQTLNARLNRISKRVGFLIEINIDETAIKKGKITFTANGYKKLFYLIEAFVINAPKKSIFEIDGFIKPDENIQKFINGTDDPHVFEDFEIKTSEVYFSIIEYNSARKNMKIKVYTKIYRYHYDNLFLMTALKIIIQSLVGDVLTP